MLAVFHEIRRALNRLRRSPWFALFAIAILGLGLGATLYMFTFVKAYMMTPLPYPQSDRIMYIERVNPLHGADGMTVTQHDFVAWQRVQESFEELAAFRIGAVNLADGGLPKRFDGAFITPSAFDIIEVNAHIGRTLQRTDIEPGAPPVIVLGYDAWLNRYNADAAILGETIRVNGTPTTVVGVMPAGFRFPLNQEAWVPLRIDLAAFSRGEGETVEVFGRLKAGVSLEAARAEFASIAAALADRYEANENITTAIKPFQHEFISNDARTVVSTMFASVLCVLLIACANVANLILARASTRHKDIALRTALGARRWRILAHVFTESIALSLAGAAMAYVLADFALKMTNRALVAADKIRPFWIDLAIDWKVVAFGAGVAIVAGAIAGFVPALHATRVNVNEHLKEGGKGSASVSGTSRSLVVVEIALSCILLVCSGLMIRSVMNLHAKPLGIETANLLTGSIGLPETEYPDAASAIRFFDQLVKRLEVNPEVLGATAAYSYPGIDAWIKPYRSRDMEVPASGRLPWANYAAVMNNYADVLGIELLDGRWFDSRDHADSKPVAVIGRNLARELFSDGDPVGQQILLGQADDAKRRWHTIIGVSEPVLLDQLDDPRHPAVFVPLAQAPRRVLNIAVRTRNDPMAFAQNLRETVFEIDPDVPVYWVRTLDNWIWAGKFIIQFVSLLFSVFAVIALVLAAAGIYGVLAYTVTQRTREIGVRRALGAADGRILIMVLGQGMLQLAFGLGIGLLGAIGFARLLSSAMRDVSPFDPFTLTVVALMLSAVAVLASLLPALRAVHVNPMEALRHE